MAVQYMHGTGGGVYYNPGSSTTYSSQADAQAAADAAAAAAQPAGQAQSTAPDPNAGSYTVSGQYVAPGAAGPTGPAPTTSRPTSAFSPSADSTGLGSGAYEQQQQTMLESRLGQEAFAQRLAALSKSGTATAPQITHSAGDGGAEAQARASSFARAKDQAGLNAQAALKSLHAVMSATGRTGSSQEADRAYEVLGTGRSDVNSFIDKQLESELQRAAQVGDMTYQGGITQRGQDLAAQQALQGLMMTSGRLY